MVTALVKIVLVAAVVQSCVKAETVEEIKKKFVDIIIGCSKDYPLLPADVEKLKNKEVPDNESAKCLLACSYKKTGMMNEDGKMSIEGIHRLNQQYFGNNPDQLMKVETFAEACANVNEVTTTDGDKGCERAALIYKCTIEKAPQFDFVV